MKGKVRISDLMAPVQAVVPAPAPDLQAEPSAAKSKGRSHTTIYLPRKTVREIKGIALEFDKKAHDLLIEGINLMLAKYGRRPSTRSTRTNAMTA